MLCEFLTNNRENLEERCRSKVLARAGRAATAVQLRDGVPLFLDQLIRTLQVEQSSNPLDSMRISGPAGGNPTLSEIGLSASRHGTDLLRLGLTVDQVVHDYGDLCQAITDLAVERDAPFQIDEFRTLNRCLDNAISEAVTEFGFQRDLVRAEAHDLESREKLGNLVHELRNLLGTASLAFSALKGGHLSLTGATGTILERSLVGLEKLLSSAVEEIRTSIAGPRVLESFSLAEFIAEVFAAASLSARMNNCTLRAPKVDLKLGLSGDRSSLLGAVSNLLQNAFKFTQPGTEVLLTAFAAGDRVQIDVSDHCGGLAAGLTESIFMPFSQSGENRTGIGLGLTIARQSVRLSGGELTVQNLPGVGCTFTISMPRLTVPD